MSEEKEKKKKAVTNEELKESIDDLTDAIRSLTQFQKKLTEEFAKWRKAGKF